MKNNLTDVNKAIENIKNIKTPIQFGALALFLVILIVLYNRPISINLLLFFSFTFPFFLIFLLFSDRSIALFGRYEKRGLNLLTGLITGAIIFGIMLLILVFANPSIISSSGLPFLKEFAAGKALESRKNEMLIQNYTSNYNQLSDLMFSRLNSIINSNGSMNVSNSVKDSADENLELQKKLEALSKKITKLKGQNSYSIYGNSEIERLIKKLQASQTSLYFSKYIFGIVYSCYSSQRSYHIDDILPVDKASFVATRKNVQWNNGLPPEQEIEKQWNDLRKINFSEIEYRVIRELGKDFIFMKPDKISTDDVQKVKVAFQNIGILNKKCLRAPNGWIVTSFLASISDYMDFTSFDAQFYEYAFDNPRIQFSIYLALYDARIIDFNKLILFFCPKNAKKILQQVMEQKLDLFNAEDARNLKSLIEKQLRNKESASYSKYILDDVISDYLEKFGSEDIQDVINSKSVEQFVIEMLRWECRNKTLTGKPPIPSTTFVSMDLSYILKKTNLGENQAIMKMASQTDNNSDLFNSYKRMLIALNLIESNLITEFEE